MLTTGDFETIVRLAIENSCEGNPTEAAIRADETATLRALLADAHARLAGLHDTDCECDNTHAANGTVCCLCQYHEALTSGGEV